MSRVFFLLTLLLAIALAVVLSAFNPDPVHLQLVFARLQLPLGVALVATFACGLLVGVLTRLIWLAQLRRECARLRQALERADQQRVSHAD